MDKQATLSPCKEYRYHLSRQWAEGRTVAFVMLNPSTADARIDDQTIRRCIGFAQAWGFGRLEVVNLFGLRSTNRAVLGKGPVDAVIGPLNDEYLIETTRKAHLVVLAWGSGGSLHNRNLIVRKMLKEVGIQAYCLKQTNKGEPCHPLYLNGNLAPQLFD